MTFLRLAAVLSSVSLALAWTTYVVPYSGGSDDTPALTAAFAANPKLARDTTILFKQGVTYNISTPIHFPSFTNVIVSVQGNLTYGANIKATQAIVASSSYPGHWFRFSGGTNVTLEGSTDPHWGWVDAHGQQWWDAMQAKSSQVNRPHGWFFGVVTTGEVKYMKLSQPIAWSISVQGNGIHVHHNTILAISANTAIPYNTDGFDVKGTNILMEDNVVYNGDDCLMLGSPSSNVHFRNSYCSGSHGLSVGPMNSASTVDIKNVLIENVVMENSVYAARFKTRITSGGVATNITWKNITMSNVRLPIFITQNYKGDGSSSSKTQDNTLIDSFTFQDFRGTIRDDANHHFVSGATGKEAVIFDMYKGSAKGVLTKGLDTTTLSGKPVTVMCDPTVISTDVGFKCWNGLFQATQLGLD